MESQAKLKVGKWCSGFSTKKKEGWHNLLVLLKQVAEEDIIIYLKTGFSQVNKGENGWRWFIRHKEETQSTEQHEG